MKLTKDNISKIHKFAKHCMKELQIKGPVHIKLSEKQTGLPTAGYFDPSTMTVFVAVHNRAMADVMRTLSHELTHVKQKEKGIAFPTDDEGLQPYEDEANTMSGRFVRFYGRKNKYIYQDLISESLSRFLYSDEKQRRSPFAVFVVARVDDDMYAATTRPADRGEAGRIGLPGGKVDPGEDPIEAAYREAREEGWEISSIDPKAIQDTLVDGKLVLWFRGHGARMLKNYKEKGRVEPIVVTREEVLNSGYGNGSLDI
jgi:hypothetical protein